MASDVARGSARTPTMSHNMTTILQLIQHAILGNSAHL